ncbi:MAG: ABC transporter ATP-binding protein, partial [Moorea sp. SIO3I7]|nr:ABC transporter ATP-binding protein [Moorena sp. SIO3I7]
MTTLEAYNLQKHYRQRGKIVAAVRGLSLTIEPGEVLAFLGSNGAGKTTSIKMIAGLIRPDRGSVKIAGRDPHRHPHARRLVGAVLEGNRNLYWRLTPEENLEYFGVLRGLSQKIAHRQGLALLDRFGLLSKRHTPVQGLSRGMQQKLAIAVALVHQPRLLLLDEPTLGLDVEASQRVKTMVREMAQAGCAILLTTHQLNVAQEIADRVAIIQQGQIIALEPTRQIIQRFSG